VKWLNRTLIAGPHLTLVTTEKQYHKVLKHCRVPKTEWPRWANGGNASTLSLENEDGEQVCIVTMHTIPKGLDRNTAHGLLVHEAVHVWQHKLEGMGETRPSSEFEAYSIQAIAQELFDQYKALK